MRIYLKCPKCELKFHAKEKKREWIDEKWGTLRKFYVTCPYCEQEIEPESPKAYPKVIQDWASPAFRRRRLEAEHRAKELLQPAGKDAENFKKVYGNKIKNG